MEGKEIWVTCIREMTLSEASPSMPSSPFPLFTKYVHLNTVARKSHINIFVQKQHPILFILLNENMKNRLNSMSNDILNITPKDRFFSLNKD